MANDFLKKEPSKNEKMIYELYMTQQQMERGLWSTSAHVCAVALALGADPQKVAEFMADEAKIKEYSDKINEVMNKLHQEKHAKEGTTHSEDEGHEHASSEQAPAEQA